MSTEVWMPDTRDTTTSVELYSSEHDLDQIRWLEDVEGYLRNYVIGSTIVLGTIGNILSIITLLTKGFRGTASGFVLTALALADLCVLNSGAMHEILEHNDIDMSKFSGLSCKIQYYAQTVSPHISAWTLVIITLERTVAVVWPHKVHILCTRKRIIILWSGIVTFLLLASAYILVLMDIQHFEDYDEATNTTDPWIFCTFEEDYEDMIDLFSYWFDTIVGAALPSFLIFAGNVAITRGLGKAKLQKLGMQTGGSAPAQKTSSVTAMLLVVSLVFLITTLPNRIYSFGMEAWFPNTEEDPLERQQENVAYTVLTALFYVNFAVNFLLYLASGTRFRKAFVELFRCDKLPTKKLSDADTLSTAMSAGSKYSVGDKASRKSSAE